MFPLLVAKTTRNESGAVATAAGAAGVVVAGDVAAGVGGAAPLVSVAGAFSPPQAASSTLAPKVITLRRSWSISTISPCTGSVNGQSLERLRANT
jgi:hypothetical protein